MIKNKFLEMVPSKKIVNTILVFIPLFAAFLPLDQFFLIGTIACLIIILNVKDTVSGFLYKRSYWFYFFNLYMLTLALLNQNIMGIIAVGFLFLITLYISYLRTFITKKYYEVIMLIIGLGSIFSLYYCTINFYTTSTYRLYEFFMELIPIPYEYITGIADNIRSSSTYINENYYGHISSFIALICLMHILQSFKKILKKNWVYFFKLFFYLLILCVNLYALSITKSRSATIGFALAVAVLILVFDGRLFILLSIPLIFFITTEYESFISLFPRLDTVLLESGDRISIYVTSLKEIFKNPFFGKGFYTYPLIYQKYTTVYQIHTHNIFLELLLDGGLFGVSILVAYYTSYIKRPIKIWAHRNKEYLPLVCGILTLEAVNGMTDAVLIFPQSFLLLSIVLLSLELNDKPQSKKGENV